MTRTRSGGEPAPWIGALFIAVGAAMLLPGASPALALALGAAFALTLGNPFPRATGRASKWLLQASVVGLGFGMSLDVLLRAGATGIGTTVAVIVGALGLGIWLGRRLRVSRDASLLVAAGTAICGGSAIAAVGSAIDADADSMSVALATVFLLNGVALYLFPAIGHALDLSEAQFGLWAAVAIHDTSSVVGAAATYGPRALEDATVLKLARALWIIPLTVAAAMWARAPGAPARGGVLAAMPWFIALFVLAALARTALPGAAEPGLNALAAAGRTGLVLTLFLIGSTLTRRTLKTAGGRPFVQGVALWGVVAGGSLWAVAS